MADIFDEELERCKAELAPMRSMVDLERNREAGRVSAMLTLEDAAGLVHMEKTYFSKRFKALTGFGFLDYLTQTRLRAAEDLLTRTSLSIGDISDACGFSGSNYFGDVFRRYHGISPSEYRIRSGSPEL